MIGLSAIGRIGLQSLRSAARGVRWDELFSGFPGVAYDKTRAESLTQDRGGLTAVTAAAQSIGLAHDYARASGGWVSGAEVIGVHTSSIDNASGGATVNHTSGSLSVEIASAGSSNVYPRLNLTNTLTVGKLYRVQGIASVPNMVAQVRLATTGSANDIAYNGTTGEFTGIAVAASTSLNIVMRGTVSGTCAFTVSVREITGNPLLAPTDARRPTWGAMANGLPCSVWDGTRAMATAAPVDFSSTDQITVMAAVRNTNSSSGFIAETSVSTTTTDGAVAMWGTSSGYSGRSRGTTLAEAPAGGIAAPNNAILVMRARISTDYLELIRNGTQIATSASDQGTGNYGNHILNIGARNAASPGLHFNGQIARIAAIGGNIGAEREAAMLGLLAAGFAPS